MATLQAHASTAVTRGSHLRLAAWLLIASPIVLLLNLLLFGDATNCPPAGQRFETVAEAAECVSGNSAEWTAFNLTGLLFIALACAGVAIIAHGLLATSARLLGITALVSTAGALLLWTYLAYLMVGLAAGPDSLPPFVADQAVNKGEGPIVGLAYQNLSGLLLTVALIAMASGLYISGLLRRMGIVVATITLVLGVVQLIAFGSIIPLVVVFGFPIAVGLLRRRDANTRIGPAANTV